MATSPGWSTCPVALGKSRTCEDAVRLKRLEYTIQFCSLAILYFDYTLTLKDEIAYIWMRRWRVSTILYFFCRYSLVANVIYLLAISEDFTGFNCTTGYKVCGTLSVFGHVGIIAVWTMRTCVLFGNKLILFAFFGACGSGVTAILIYRIPLMSCSGGRDISTVLGVNASLVLFIELLSFFLATWHIRKMIRSQKQADDGTSSSFMRLHRLILSQGVYYILAIFVFAMAQLVLNFRWKTGFSARLVNAIKVPLSGFLTARFMLQLRIYGFKTVLDGETRTTRWDDVCDEFNGEINFARRSELEEEVEDSGLGYDVEFVHHQQRDEIREIRRTATPSGSRLPEWGTERNV
ncbi:hypothetical protein BKA70DRAFT_1325852 [Coprinopsis sp. MPI-PUGE-AT-0042]|nr:hypothetical protein BKA70DRAFT_1325852 [Coprinopsis sp. MPI-PUGE-AT-0042]